MTTTVNVASEVKARAASEASATAEASDKSCTTASTKATIRWKVNMGMVMTKINRMLSIALSVVVLTAK